MSDGIKLLLIIFLLSFASQSHGEAYRRFVSFDWEEIPDVKTYEIELKPVAPEQKSEKSFIFKSNKASWGGKLFPGKYLMRLRSLDHRNVAGEWSEFTDFNVQLEPVKIISPTQDFTDKTNQEKEKEIEFKWDATGGALGYEFEISSTDKSFSKIEKINSTALKLTLPVSQKYEWKITALASDDLKSEKSDLQNLTLIGKKLTPPKIKQPENEFVRELNWESTESIKNYNVSLQQYSGNKQWTAVESHENFKEDILAFNPSYKGGSYRLTVISTSNLRESSGPVSVVFKVKNGDRTYTAEYLSTLKNSIDRTKGWYSTASWLLTMMNYESSYNSEPLNFSNAFGGTGRLGLGYQEGNKAWGFNTIADLSGIIIRKKNYLFASAEANAVYKKYLSEREEARFNMGLFYKEFPVTYPVIALPLDPSNSQYNTGNTGNWGAHVSAEYWYSVSPNLGVQGNIHLYQSLLTTKALVNGDNTQFSALQIGFLGSYRINKKMTGLMGYAYRTDEVQFKHPEYTRDSIIIASDKTKAKITGHYLNLYAEWDF